MSRSPYRDFEGSRGEFLKLLAEQGEEPSFLRRAKAVEDAWTAVLKRCQSLRDDMLRWPRMHLGNLARQVGNNWSRLAEYLADATQAAAFAALYDEWKPQLPTVIKSASPWATIQTSLRGFVDSVRKFNAAWDAHLQSVDLTEVNQLRSDYNKYYPTEKAAAFDSEDIGRLGFTPLEMAAADDLRAHFPPLQLPALR
jgi:hypothetical protein